MLKVLEKLFPARLRQNFAHRAWIVVVLVILFSVAVRVRLGDMSLERDEGEYAYAGQLLLEGVPPYKEAYNMKLPGTYLAYAASMASNYNSQPFAAEILVDELGARVIRKRQDLSDLWRGDGNGSG